MDLAQSPRESQESGQRITHSARQRRRKNFDSTVADAT